MCHVDYFVLSIIRVNNQNQIVLTQWITTSNENNIDNFHLRQILIMFMIDIDDRY